MRMLTILRASGDLLRTSVNPDVFCSCSQSAGSASFNHVFSLSPACPFTYNSEKCCKTRLHLASTTSTYQHREIIARNNKVQTVFLLQDETQYRSVVACEQGAITPQATAPPPKFYIAGKFSYCRKMRLSENCEQLNSIFDVLRTSVFEQRSLYSNREVVPPSLKNKIYHLYFRFFH